MISSKDSKSMFEPPPPPPTSPFLKEDGAEGIDRMSSSFLYTVKDGGRWICEEEVNGNATKEDNDDMVLNVVQTIKGEGKFFWLDLLNPSEKLMDSLQSRLGYPIHPLTQEDILQEERREKCELWSEEYIFIAIKPLNIDELSYSHRSAQQSNSSSSSSSTTTADMIYLISFLDAGSHGPIISVHFGSNQLPFLENLLFKRLSAQSGVADSSALTSDWIAYLVMDEIVDQYLSYGHLLQQEIDTIEDLTQSLGHFDQLDMLRRIYQAERKITLLSRSIQPKMDILRIFLKSIPPTSKRTLTYIRDVEDHLHSSLQYLTEYRENLSRLHDHYIGQSDISMTLASHQIDESMNRLTILSFILGFVLTISSIWGMNVPVPWDIILPDNTYQSLSFEKLYSFGLVLLLMLFSVLLTIFHGHRKHWF